ncbi:MAG: hypothetical protein HC838_16150 [Spirulinaceae cyanobacterium RM2_2_10]|nr:hypothetical protein [Spirulinaceae cyanobacterium RM2_2_10]
MAALSALSFSPDGRYLASASTDGNIKLWALPAGERVASDARGGNLQAIAFSADSRLLSSVSRDGRVRRWSVSTQAEISSWRALGLFAAWQFSPDGRLLALSGGRSLELRAVDSGKTVASSAGDDRWSSLAFRPDGGAIAAGGKAGQVQLWLAPETIRAV